MATIEKIKQPSQTSDLSSELTVEQSYLPIVELIYQISEKPEQWPQLVSYLAASRYDLSNLPEKVQQEVGSLLSKHLTRALKISKNISQMRQHDQLLDDVFGHAPIGILYLNANDQIVYINPLAEQMLANEPELKKDLILTHQKEGLSSNLKDKISPSTKECVSFASKGGLSIYQIPVEDVVQQPLRAMLLVDNTQNVAVDEQRAKALYQLTDTEQKVMSHLLSGASVNNIAGTLDRSLNTIKHHIKNIYLKLGTQNRSTLIKKLVTSSRVVKANQLAQNSSFPTDPNTHYFYYGDFRLAYSSFGPDRGEPLVLMHSHLGNALEIPADLSYLDRYNLRLLIPERPGYGYSNDDSKHCYRSWSKILQAWLDELQIEQFRLLGNTSGTPFALQLAKDVGDRVKKLGLISVFPNVAAIKDVPAHTSGTRTLLKIFNASPLLIKPILSAMLLNPPEFFVNKFLLNGGPPYCAEDIDKEWLSRDEIAQQYIQQLQRTKRQGARGLVREFQLISQPWPEELFGIGCPVHIWQGSDDRVSTIENFNYLMAKLPSAESHLLENETGTLYLRYFPEIVASIL